MLRVLSSKDADIQGMVVRVLRTQMKRWWQVRYCSVVKVLWYSIM